MVMNPIERQNPDAAEEGSLSLVLFSGTDDKLTAAAVMAVGAAAMGRRVNVFVQYWAIEAFVAGAVHKDRGAVTEAGGEGSLLLRRALDEGTTQHWSDLLAQAKDIGEVAIHACALSMEIYQLKAEDLDPLVDGVRGVAAFMLDATGPIVFI